MERGDLVTLAAGIAIVIIIAIIMKSGVILQGNETAITIPVTFIPTSVATTIPSKTIVTSITTPKTPEPLQITYSRTPLDYPVIRIPDSMVTFGGSDIAWKSPEIVTVAVMQGSRGGLSQEFIVPYELWGLNITVEAWTKPQYARFDVVLCLAEDGTVIDGIEILNRGTAFKSIQISGKPMYLIIQAENVDRFRIGFITPKDYYDKTKKKVIAR